jgi:oligopeptide/dipeptide ABC transporter ATP-binding protein
MGVILEGINISHIFFTKDRISQNSQVKALQEVSFTVHEGTTMSVVGESGSGKTTLANIILKLIKPTEGDVLFKGKSIYQSDVAKIYNSMIYGVFQNPSSSLNPRLNIFSSISEPLMFRSKLSKDKIREAVYKTIEEVNLNDDVLSKYPHELSGGEKQRVSIARAIISKPQIVVLDEPISSLDVSIRAQILNLLKNIKKDHNLTYIFISHDIATTRFISDYVMILYKGRVMEVGESEEIFTNPLNPYTKLLIYSVPGQNIIKEEIKLEERQEKTIGCPFYNRCPIALENCKNEFPKPRKISENHIVMCHTV